MIKQHLTRDKQRLNQAHLSLSAASPQMIIKARKEAISAMGERLPSQAEKVIRRDSQRVDHLKTILTSLSPLATLERGYAIVSNEQGQVITDSSEANVGDAVSVRLHRGGLTTVVSETQD